MSLLFLLPSALLVSVGWFLYEPRLLTSAILIIWVLVTIIFTKKLSFRRTKLLIVPILIPTSFMLSALVNQQSFSSLFIGGNQRNLGLTTLVSLSLVFIIFTSEAIDLKKSLNYGFFVVLLISIFYGYLQYFNLDPIPWSIRTQGLSLTLGNQNFAGALFGMLGVIVFAYIVRAKMLQEKIAYAIILISLFFLGLQTKSLQFQVVLCLNLIVFLFVFSLGKKSILFLTLNYSIRGVLISAPLIIISIFVFNAPLQIRDWFVYEGNILSRLDYWRTGLSIWRDNPFFGVGIDQFYSHSRMYRTPEQIVRDGDMVVADKAHNVLIDYLANGGLIAGILWVTLVTSVFFALIKIIRNSFENRLEVSILAGTWSAYILQSLISPDHIILSVIGYSTGGLIIGQYLKLQVLVNHKQLLVKNSHTIKIIMSLMLVFSCVIYSKALSANVGAKNMLSGKFTKSEEYIKVLDAWPNPLVAELVGVELSKNAKNCELVEEIASRLIKWDKRSSQSWYLRAVCADSFGEYTLALTYVVNSLKFDPLNPFYLTAKAQLEINTNNLDDASSTISKLKLVKPLDPNIPVLDAKIISLQTRIGNRN